MTPTRPTQPGPPVAPLSDEQATRQVIDIARSLNAALPLPDLFGSFSFESCNDQGDPPYRGLLKVDFDVPHDSTNNSTTAVKDERARFYDAVASTLTSQGWSDGPGPGLHLYGRALHKGEMMALIDPGSGTTSTIEIRGECRNVTDHHNDGKTNWVDLTDRITG